MRKWTRFTLASAALAAGVALWAAGPGGGRMAQEMGLSKEQAQKLETLRYDHEKEVAELRHQAHLKGMDLRREMEKDSPDPAVLDRLVDEAGALKAKLQKARIRHMLELKKVLTSEQWEKFRDRFGPPGRGGEEGGGMGRGRRGDPGGPRGGAHGERFCPAPGAGPGGGSGPGAQMGPPPGGGPGPGPQGPPAGDDDDDDF